MLPLEGVLEIAIKNISVVTNSKSGWITKIENENSDKSSHSGIKLTTHITPTSLI